jgi:hypothetical protein
MDFSTLLPMTDKLLAIGKVSCPGKMRQAVS